MRYALNVTPLNGWETLLGSGQADAALSVSGDGVKWVLNYGVSADMALSVGGAGAFAVFGYGQADQTLTADGTGLTFQIGVGDVSMSLSTEGQGYAEIHLSAEASDMVLNAAGTGYGAFFAVGETASMILSALGEGHRELRAIAEADLAMDGGGTPYVIMYQAGQADLVLKSQDQSRKNIAVLGRAQADMIASGLAGIPHPHIRPSTYIEAKHVLKQGEEDRTLEVPDELKMKPLRERRPLQVARGDRRL